MSSIPRVRPSRRVALAGFALLVLSGCAIKPKTPEELVAQRAHARWQAQLRGDFQAAYAYLSPGSKAVVSPDLYRARTGGAVAYKDVEVASVRCETSEKCIATIRVRYEPIAMRQRIGIIESYLDETWLFDAGQWWFLYRL